MAETASIDTNMAVLGEMPEEVSEARHFQWLPI
jgi:hypothetical protein